MHRLCPLAQGWPELAGPPQRQLRRDRQKDVHSARLMDGGFPSRSPHRALGSRGREPVLSQVARVSQTLSPRG